MATNWLLRSTVDLASPKLTTDIVNAGYIFRDDENAHVWEITVLDGGVAADLTGYGAVGYFIRSDDNTVIIAGTISGNVVTVQLNANCYAYRGLLKGVIRIEKTNSVISIGAMHVRIDVATTAQAVIDDEILIRFETSVAAVESLIGQTGNYYTKEETLNAIYPIGAIFVSVASTNPGTYLGGTWEAYSQGRVLLGAGEGTDDNQYNPGTFSAGDTGGEYRHTLTTTEIPAHSHTYNRELSSGTDSGVASARYSGSRSAQNTGSTGGGEAHNNLQPYIVAYIWRRTA